jgi:CBS domain containing-hemolysin-like protein
MDPDIVRIFIAMLLVGLNGFFVAAEFAIVKVRYSQIQLKAAEGNLKAKQAEKIINNLDAYLSATQLGITLASLALGWVGESAIHHAIDHALKTMQVSLSESTLSTISFTLSFTAITTMHIVFGELVPKSIAIRKSEETTFFIAYPLKMFYNIFQPFIWLMNAFSNAFLRLIKIDPAGKHEIHSTEELQLLVKQSADGGQIQEENYEIIKNAFDFTDHNVKQIMVPRQNIFCIDIASPQDEIMDSIINNGYSRIPVYQNSVDNIIGMFYTKEVIRAYFKAQNDQEPFDLEALVREAFFVVKSKKISDVLSDFQRKKQHLAVVIDEFGGTEGIVSLEDILEELVGEIQDEDDDEEKMVIEVAENTFHVVATQPINEINDFLPEPFEEDPEYNTLAGYVLHHSKEIPEEKQQYNFQNYHLSILRMQNKSVELVELVYIKPNIINDLLDELSND